MINFELRFFFSLVVSISAAAALHHPLPLLLYCCRFCWHCYCCWFSCRILFGYAMAHVPRKMRFELNMAMNANISSKLFINILLVEMLWHGRCGFSYENICLVVCLAFISISFILSLFLWVYCVCVFQFLFYVLYWFTSVLVRQSLPLCQAMKQSSQRTDF